MTRIVVIDDNADVRGEVAAVLRFEGHEVIEAGNAQAGIESVRGHQPDLVICDVMMPGMDGYQALETLRADPVLATVPFIFLTARADRTGMRRGMEEGADDWVTKPFTLDELLGAVRGALERRARVEHEADRKVSTLCAQLSLTLPHELRTPLNVIMGYAELLSDPKDVASPEDVSAYASRILTAAQRLHRLTENFLLSAQIQMLASSPGGAVALGDATSRIAEVVVPVAQACAAAAGRAADLCVQACDGLLALEETALVKIVSELVDNACKFSPPASPVVVEVAPVGERFQLRVSDRGRGMTSEQLANVGVYAQLDREQWEQEGMGLGLGIARGIAKLWGGDLVVESTGDRGTTIRVDLAAASPARRPGASDPSRPDAGE